MAKFVVTGNECTIVINNVKVPLMQTLRATDDYGHEPASGIGDIHVTEYTPTLARHSIAISRFVMTLDQAINAGIILANGDDAMRNLEFDIEVMSKDGSTLMKKYLRCKNNSSDISVTAHRVLVSDANFVGIDTTALKSAPGQGPAAINY